jgi:hypothetical protein
LTAVPGVLPAGDPGADLGQHVELRRPDFLFPLMDLNSKLPKTARPKAWSHVVLLNFVFDQLTRGGSHPARSG